MIEQRKSVQRALSVCTRFLRSAFMANILAGVLMKKQSRKCLID
jgi:hypothetical protein